MDDCIRRQAAIDEICKMCDCQDKKSCKVVHPTFENWCDPYMALLRVPSVPVRDVVLCKDCKHFAGEGMYCAQDIVVQYDHFYCYYGERKDG